MGCVTLLNGLDLTCRTFNNRYYQSIVLINRSDVDEVMIQNNNSKHNIAFNLKAGKSGVLFMGNESVSVFTADFDKTTEKGIPLYSHNLELPVVGTGEDVKVLLKQLDAADVFAAIQFRSGDVEIYGFENGLVSQDYNYSPQSALGGAVIPISSRHREYNPPYIYRAGGLENEHYNNLFTGIGNILGGDFNNDFNNDFDIQEV